jgi:hypothetical protein
MRKADGNETKKRGGGENPRYTRVVTNFAKMFFAKMLETIYDNDNFRKTWRPLTNVNISSKRAKLVS